MSQVSIEALWPIRNLADAGMYKRLAESTEASLITLGIRPTCFSHVGIAVHDVKASGAVLSEKDDPAWRDVKVEWGAAFGCKVIRRWVEGMEIEIIEPVEPSHLREFLLREGEGVHHISFEVADVAAVIHTLRAVGGELAHAQIMNGLHGRIAFLSAKSVCPVSLELCQPVPH